MSFSMGMIFLWGLLESLWFFIVPDVALSFIAAKGWRSAILSTLVATFGSMVAASFLYFLMSFFPFWIDMLKNLWSYLPGFYPNMLKVAANHLQENQALGLLSGPTSGIPYRYYVLEAYKANISLSQLLLWTPIARLERMVIAPLAVLLIKFILTKLNLLFPKFTEKIRRQTLFILISFYWIFTYIWYWFYFLPKTYGVSL